MTPAADTPLAALAGRWTGSSRLVLSWETPSEYTSDSTAEVTVVAGGRFVTIAYTWTHKDRPREGFLLAGRETKTEVAHASWVDSYHQREFPMTSRGTVTADGGIDVLGSFPAGDGPDWGWRTEVTPTADGFAIRMYVIPPGEAEQIGFENVYTRG
ncbi:DUF1579 family protein [Roseisolibacter sp. H3M3-2]|uniref:DUF1579 family protein n=1 Tax=Roseisolibacter sp. H3M3-2 TaxID=3031323 RepID=UPI0023DAA11E|nr:DUF1579 family protein [Roseisolibacter sp. H3M3-2]MDF1504821.1 DUF1579 family protein [Roseisolibacter sp. H3M3-2]